MDITSSVLLMWFGLMSLPTPPTYEIENFYTYDRSHKQQPLILQKKIFLPEGKATDLFLSKIKPSPKADFAPGMKTAFHVQKIKSPVFGRVVPVADNKDAIELMARLAKEGIPYSPVVQWEGMDCIPTNTLIIKTKPFVTEKLLKERLEQSAKVKVVSIEKFGGNQWTVEVKDPVVPSNVLVLANMISEDTAWVDWARVVFRPIYDSISGRMNVTTPAVVNLGYNKQLEIVINVYKPTIKIRKDLLPKLGHNFFVPQPPPTSLRRQTDDVWYDFGPTTITEEKTPEKTVIRITTPFRYLNFGAISINSIQVAFDDGKKEGTFVVTGTEYVVQSVIAGTDIDDIQAMSVFPTLPIPVATDKFSRVMLPWRIVGFVTATGGFLCVLMVCAIVWGSGLRDANQERAILKDRKKLWHDLLEMPTCNEKTWRIAYKKFSVKLSKVLAEFYDIHVPVASDSVDNASLCRILRELEKLYKAEAIPEWNKLLHDVEHFVHQESNKYV